MKLATLALFLLVTPFLCADSIDYAGSGSLSGHTATITGSASAGHTWGVDTELTGIDDLTTGINQQGDLGDVNITTGTLSSCTSGLCFTGGKLDITSTSGAQLVDESFTSGTIARIGGFMFLNATLPNGATVLLADAHGNFSSDSTITATSGAVPEPAGLFLMGSGLLGLCFARRFIN